MSDDVLLAAQVADAASKVISIIRGGMMPDIWRLRLRREAYSPRALELGDVTVGQTQDGLRSIVIEVFGAACECNELGDLIANEVRERVPMEGDVRVVVFTRW